MVVVIVIIGVWVTRLEGLRGCVGDGLGVTVMLVAVGLEGGSVWV